MPRNVAACMLFPVFGPFHHGQTVISPARCQMRSQRAGWQSGAGKIQTLRFVGRHQLFGKSVHDG
jgi:hypothetical protein